MMLILRSFDLTRKVKKITENLFKVRKFHKELSFRIYSDYLLIRKIHIRKPKRKWTKDMKRKFVK